MRLEKNPDNQLDLFKEPPPLPKKEEARRPLTEEERKEVSRRGIDKVLKTIEEHKVSKDKEDVKKKGAPRKEKKTNDDFNPDHPSYDLYGRFRR